MYVWPPNFVDFSHTLTLVSASSVGGIGCTVSLVIDPSFSKVRRFRVIGIVWNTSAALVDVIIAAALVWHLVCSANLTRTETFYADTYLRSMSQWRHKTGVTATDNLINKIIRRK